MINCEEEYTKFEQEEVAGNRETFVVDSEEKANWALRKVAEHEAVIKKATDFVARENERLERYKKTITDSEQASIEHLTMMLRPFAEKAIAGGKKKTVSLPNGKLSFRAANETYLKDEPKLLAFVEKADKDLIKVKKSVDWANFKKKCSVDDGRLITADGEVVEGVTVIPAGPDVFTVKAGE